MILVTIGKTSWVRKNCQFFDNCRTSDQTFKVHNSLKDCVSNCPWNQIDQAIVVNVSIDVHKIDPSQSQQKTDILNKMLDARPKSAYSLMKYMQVYVLVSVLAVLVVVDKTFWSTPTPIQPEERDLNDMYVQYEFDNINGGVSRLGSVGATDKSPTYGYAEQTELKIESQRGDGKQHILQTTHQWQWRLMQRASILYCNSVSSADLRNYPVCPIMWLWWLTRNRKRRIIKIGIWASAHVTD